MGTTGDQSLQRETARKPNFLRYGETWDPQIVLNQLKGYLDIKDMTFETTDIENENDHGFSHCSKDTDT